MSNSWDDGEIPQESLTEAILAAVAALAFVTLMMIFVVVIA